MWFALAFAYLALAIGCHAALARVAAGGGRVKQFVLAGAGCGIALMLHLAFAEVGALRWLAATLVYAFACELYIFLFTFVGTSVSVALLVSRGGARAPSPGGGGSLSPEEMVGRRLQGMVAAGLLAEEGNGWRLAGRAPLLVSLYLALRRFFRHLTTREFQT